MGDPRSTLSLLRDRSGNVAIEHRITGMAQAALELLAAGGVERQTAAVRIAAS